MLLHLTLRNFKIWKTTGLIKLAPVTLLLGTNSSGKSSIIQSLLLIRQTVRSKEPNVSLHFGIEGTSDSVALGQFNDVVCRNSPKKEIGIEFTWTEAKETERSYTFSAIYKRTPSGATIVDTLSLDHGGRGFSVKRRSKGAFELSIGTGSSLPKRSLDFHPQNSFTFSAATLAKLPPLDAEEIKGVGTELLDELEKIIYLGPVRRLAQRHYSWDGVAPLTLGDDGDRAIQALIASGLRAKKKQTGGDLFNETAHWLKEMGLATGLEAKRAGTSSLYELVVLNEGSCSNLKDVGVGVAQVLPVIVACLFAPKGHIVIVEEPESHLHPLAQSVLAELFAKVSSERGIQVIAETHSEHLFRRTQTLIAKDEIRRDQCAPYFVERKEGIAKLISLEVDAFGRINNWPPKFFGDSLGESKALTELMIEKLKAQKQNAQAP